MDIIPQLIANSIIAAAIYALVALGFNLIFSTARFFDLGYGALAAVGGYAVFYFGKTLGLPLVVALLLALIIGAGIAWLGDRFIYRTLRARKASTMVQLVAALGFFTAIQAIIAILFTSQFQTLASSSSTQRVYNILGGVVTEVQLIIMGATIAIMLALALILKFTRFGKAIKAVSDDEEVAKIMGINSDRIVGGVFAIGGAIAALAGVLVGYDTGIEPTMGMALLLKGVIAAIVGGIGNVYGGVLGALLLGFAENFGIWKISGEWKDAIAFGILLVFLLVRPQGILKK